MAGELIGIRTAFAAVYDRLFLEHMDEGFAIALTVATVFGSLIVCEDESAARLPR